MKKSGVMLLILVLLVSISFASAGLFDDVWSKITGRTIENVTESEPETCAASIDVNFNQDVYYIGDSLKITVEVFDSQGNRIPNVPFYVQAYEDGEWYDTELESTGQETTNEQGYFEQINDDIVFDESAKVLNKFYTKETSSCPSVEDTVEVEYISREREESRPEPSGSSGGGGGQESEILPETCAARIKLTFDKNIYYIGETMKITLEILDSQGNRIPNYLFYGQTCNAETGECTSQDSGRTDADGYLKAEAKVEEAGKGMSKVWTKAIGTCAAIPTLTIEFEIKKEKPVPCGIGTCVPEEEAKEVEAIPEDKVFYKCNGCELEGKCYPMGYRKEGKYCSDNNEFVSQIDGECDNSFECESNVCVSGECVDEGLIKKILKWFKKLFGGEDEDEEPKEKQCSKWLIEEDIGDYEYGESGYGDSKEAQAPLYSEDGEQIGVVKCCRAQYLYQGRHGGMALICPFDNREDVGNSLRWLSARGEITSGEYKDEQVYKIGEPVIIWTHKDFAIAVGGGEGPEPEMNVPLPEDVADAYLKKYKNDLDVIDTPKPPMAADEFLKEVENLGVMTLIDFESLLDGTIPEREQRINDKEWESLGVVFETPSEDYLQLVGPVYPFNPIDKLSLSPGLGPFVSGSDTHDDLNIIFTEPVKAVGVYLLDLGETDERESITFLDENRNVIEKISPWPKSTFGNPAPGVFVSLIHEGGISKIEILENTQDSDDIAYDNLYFVR